METQESTVKSQHKQGMEAFQGRGHHIFREADPKVYKKEEACRWTLWSDKLI